MAGKTKLIEARLPRGFEDRMAPKLALVDGMVQKIRAVYERYGLDGPQESLRDIGERVGLSGERVRQIEERALGKLRAAATHGDRD